jgi:hypothetical protein
MRTLLLFAPALICSGTMIACFRMMFGRRRTPDAREALSADEVVDPAGSADASSEPENR